MPDDPDREPPLMSGFGQAMSLSMEMVVTTLVGLGLGWLADAGLNTGPLFTVVGVMLGAAGGINRAYRSWKTRSWG
ncbi:MAG: AtpZ/AtpI family protein [Actinomycetota bacterium]